MSAATKRGSGSRRAPDRLCAEAVDVALSGVEETAEPGTVGPHIEAVAEGDRVVTHYFEAAKPAYRGWRWAATVARASRARVVTVDEIVLLPGADALLAPEWLPWNERLRPGDLGAGDLLPTESDDPRLEPGYSGEHAPPNSAVSAEAEERAEDAERAELGAAAEEMGAPVDAEDLEVTAAPPRELPPRPTTRGSIAAVAEEMGLGRPRVLSRYGLREAADRWAETYGSSSPVAQAAPANCVSCGFLLPMAGSLRQAFGVCGNEYSPADGHVVSLEYGCGGHSEAAVMPKTPQPPPPVIDETRPDALDLPSGGGAQEERPGGSGEDAAGSGES